MRVENFKYIENTNNTAQIGDMGTVKVLVNKEFKDKKGNIYNTSNWEVVHKDHDKDGYEIVKLPYYGDRCFVHGLVAKHFKKKPTISEYYGIGLFSYTEEENKLFQSKLEVNHIDSTRTNNVVDNLEWLTHSDNMRYSITDNPNRPKSKKQKIAVDVFKDNILIETCSSIAEAGEKYNDISKSGVKGAHISKCVRGLIPSYKGYVFKPTCLTTNKLF
ncbi:HNH endonuclease [uncultured Clostridium sp.]|uniref:HNH endonuclease n=1 Tax=uncultured Clostridium sp. TaxID=59620 RepID=UPI0026F1E394|nr:HNH endonuclease [uncultured Clostridium sp.]